MSRIRIGWATRDVSTNKPVDIPGQLHMRISKGILDPITVNVLVLDSGTDMAIFLSGDFVSIQGYLIEEVRGKVGALKPEIPMEKIMIHATHTHCGASYYPEGEETYPPHEGIEIASSEEYREFLAAQMTEAIIEAYENRKEGGIAYGYGYAVTGHSRRTVYMDDLSLRPGAKDGLTYVANGHASMYGDSNDPMFSGYEAGSNAVMNVMYTFDGEDKLTGAVINVPCPSQASELEYYLSADFWHNVREAIWAKYGRIHILAQCAAAGDLAPRILHDYKAQERRFRLKYADVDLDERIEQKLYYYMRLDIAERISACFDEVLSWASKDIQKEIKICHRTEHIELDRTHTSIEDYEFYKRRLEHYSHIDYVKTEDIYADFKQNSILNAYRRQCTGAMERYENENNVSTFPVELHVVKVGEIAFATNPFELYMDFQHRIQARSPFIQTFVVQLCCPMEHSGYLATKRGAANRGYSAIPASCKVSPEGGQQLVEETVRILKEL